MAHDGRIDMAPSEQARYRAHIKDWSGKVVIHVRPWKAKRSGKQNARHWALCTVGARELGWDSPTDLHDSLCLKFLRLPDDDATGLPRRRSTTKLTTAEMSELDDAIERYLRYDLHLDLTGWELEAERIEAA